MIADSDLQIDITDSNLIATVLSRMSIKCGRGSPAYAEQVTDPEPAPFYQNLHVALNMGVSKGHVQGHLILTVLVLKYPCFNNHTISAGNFLHIHLSAMGIHESILAVASHKSLSAVSIHKFAIRGVNLQVAICGVNLQVAIHDHKSLSAVSICKSLSAITSRYPQCQPASRYPRCQSRGGRCQLAIGVT